ncbi:MAG TPA: copper homeostasis protein CutC [Ignavibacteria bacterium]|nr:copper homeostasis protein CutC [Ignavibacteria bacterium]
MQIIYEIACFDYESAVKAAAAGADRIELCSDKPSGGVTPSLGTIEKTRGVIKIDLNVIIRTRGGDFRCSDSEFDIMKRDIVHCRNAGVNGVVFGILNENGQIDVKRNLELVVLARPMSATFHRAFDLLPEPGKCIEDVIGCGFARLLTSGCPGNAVDGISVIKNLVKKSEGRIIVMPGGNVRKNNIRHIVDATGVSEVHSSSIDIIGCYESQPKFCTKL